MLELFKELADWPYFSHLYTDGGKYTQGRGGEEELYTDVDKNTRDGGWGVKKSYTLMRTSIFRRKKTLYTDVDKYTRDGGGGGGGD